MSANAEVTERTPLWRSPSAAAARSTGLAKSASPAEPAAKSATTAVELAFMGSNLSAGLVATWRPVAQCSNSQGFRTYHEAEARSCQVLGGWLARQHACPSNIHEVQTSSHIIWLHPSSACPIMPRELLIHGPDGQIKNVPLVGARVSVGRSGA